jgi:hypothetical protein
MRGIRGIAGPSVGGGAGSVNISAGTTSNNLTNLVFATSPTVTFGLNGSTITASAVGGAGGSLNLSAGTTSNNLTAVTFANSNGVSFGLNASTITATVKTDYLTTAMASNRGSDFVAATAAFAGTSASGTIASNGISVSIGPYITTAMLSNAATISNIRLSAGTTSNLASAFTFADSNGVSFGLNAGTITGTVKTDYLTTAMLSNAATISNINVSAGTTSNNLSKLTFDNAGGITFGLNGSVITAAAPAGAPSPVNFSAGTTSNNLASVVFSNSNHVSFGLNGSTITASFNPINIGVTDSSASGTTGTLDGANGQYLFFGGSNITISQSLNGSSGSLTIIGPNAAAGYTGSYFANAPVLANSGASVMNQTISAVQPLMLSNAISFDFVRFFFTASTLAASTTAATTGNTQFSCGFTRTHNFAIYSKGTGANSSSLQYVTSTQVSDVYSNNVSAAANSTQFSYSNRYTFPCSTGIVAFTKDYSSSAASLNYHSSLVTDFTSVKQLDFPFAATLPAGHYWLMYGISTNSASQFTSVGFRGVITMNPIAMSANTIKIGTFGADTNQTLGWAWAGGGASFTSAGAATTSSLNFTNLTSAASHMQIYFQLMRTV